jgi:hypothetical protein
MAKTQQGRCELSGLKLGFPTGLISQAKADESKGGRSYVWWVKMREAIAPIGIYAADGSFYFA